MRESYNITTPFVTPEETARILGVPSRRAKQLIKMVEESLAKKGVRAAANGKNASASKNGTSVRAVNANAAKVKVRAKTRGANPRSASRRKLARGKEKTSH
jgi:hypothetical protein